MGSHSGHVQGENRAAPFSVAFVVAVDVVVEGNGHGSDEKQR